MIGLVKLGSLSAGRSIVLSLRNRFLQTGRVSGRTGTESMHENTPNTDHLAFATFIKRSD